ncbi:MAG: cell wall surface anchor family protein, partial [Candidatus Peregrinibacteria bacterium Gr01-1014_25]
MHIHLTTSADVRRLLAEAGIATECRLGTKDERAAWIFHVLDSLAYARRAREEKGVIRECLQEATGYSRAQVARYISSHQARALLQQATTAAAAATIPAAANATGLPLWAFAATASILLAVSLRGSAALRGSLVDEPLPVRVLTTEAIASTTTAGVVQTATAPASGNRPSFLDAVMFVADDAAAFTPAPLIPEPSWILSQPIDPAAAALRDRVALRRTERLVQPAPGSPADIDALQRDLVAIGPGADGYILTSENGKLVWRDLLSPLRDLLHGAAPSAPKNAAYNPPYSGVGRLPYASSEQEGEPIIRRRGGGGGGGGSTTTSTTIINQTTGLSETDGDSRYVNVTGDDMTGALSIVAAGTALTVRGSTSGAIIHAGQTLTTSGALIWEGAASGASLYVATSLNGAGLTDCDVAGTSKLLWDATLGRFSCGTDQNSAGSPEVGTITFSGGVLRLGDSRYVNVAGDTMTGALTITVTGGTNRTLGLEVLGTISGSYLRAQDVLTSSGTLVWEGAASGASLYVATSLNGAGLTDCDVAGTSKLLWDATTGRFSCGTDQNSGGTPEVGTSSFSGGVLVLADPRYVNTSGDTMTGALTITVTGGTNRTLGLEVLGTVSGSHLRAQDVLTSSGTLVWEGAASGASLYIGTSLNGAGLVDCDAATQTLAWDATTGRFSCGSDSDTTYTAAQGLTLTATAFSLSSTISGTLLEFQTVSGALVQSRTTLASSGTLVFEGAGSGASLYVATSLNGAGLTDCDTSTQVLKWDSTTGRFSCGTSSGTFGSGNVLALGDSRYVNVAGDTMTGALTITVTGGTNRTLGLEVFGTVSGSHLRAQDVLTSSGTLVWEGAASGASLYVATSLNGAGLTDCDVAGTSKLLWDATTGRFSCGTDTDTTNAPEVGTITFSGGVLRLGDSRYVNTAGDTMTGALTINVTGGNPNTLGLNVLNAISGAVIRAQKTLASSGTLVVEGAMSGASLYVATSVQGAGLVDCDAATSTLAWDATTGRFSCGSDSDTTYTAAQGLTLTATAFSLSSTISGTLLEFQTVSGALVQARTTLASSGTLVFEGAGSGASLYVATSLNGAGLTDCDVAGTSKLLWDSTTGRFSCGTDQNSAGSPEVGTSSFSGGVLRLGDSRYVNTAGDTMTGALTITVTGGGNRTLGLEVLGTISGSHLRAQDVLTSSGTLVVEGAMSGASLYVATSLNGAGLTDCDVAGTSKLLWDATAGRFSCGTDQNSAGSPEVGTSSFSGGVLRLGDSRYVNVAGDTMTGALTILVTGGTNRTVSLEAFGTVSGSHLRAQDVLTSSGTLVWEGAASGASLYVATSLNGAGLTDCDVAGTSKLLWDATTGRFSCGTDTDTTNAPEVGTSSFSGGVLRLGDSRYVNTSGDSMTGALTINLTSGYLGLNVLQTMSGNIIHAEKNLTSSGTLMVNGDVTLRGSTITLGQLVTDRLFFNAGIASSAIPWQTNTYDLGSSTLRWRDLYLSGGTIRIGAANNDATIGYHSGNKYLSFSTNGGMPEMVLLTGGKLGIGTVNPGSQLSVSGAVVINPNGNIGSVAADAGLAAEIIGTASGRVLYAQTALRSSGSLVFEGAASGASLYVGTSLNGVGLTDCDVAGTSKLLWDATLGRFSCGTDTDTTNAPEVGTSSFSGGVLRLGDSRYVNTSGDTMTGALTILVTGGTNRTVSLEAFGTVSGSHLRAQDVLTSSGTLVVEGAMSGASLYVGTSINGAGLTDCDAANQTLNWDATTGRFSCGTDANDGSWSNTGSLLTAFDARYVNQSGDTMTGALTITVTGGTNRTLGLEVLGTVSGSHLRAQDVLTSSGTLVWEGAASGASLYVGTSINGAGLTDCDAATS